MKNSIVLRLSLGLALAVSLACAGHAEPGMNAKGAAVPANVEMAPKQPDKPNPKSIKVRIKKVSLKGIPPSIHAVMITCHGYVEGSKGPGMSGARYGGYGVGGGDITIDQRDPDKQTKPFDVEGGPYDVVLYPNDGKSKPEDIDPIKNLGCGLLFFVHKGPTIFVGNEPSYQGSKVLEGADISGSWKLVKNFP